MTCEVFGCFVPWIKQGETVWRGVKTTTRQGYVPDFLINAATPPYLADVKTFSVNKTNYPGLRGGRKLGAVLRREGKTHGECVKKLAAADSRWNGHTGSTDRRCGG